MSCREVLAQTVAGGPFGEYRLEESTCAAAVDGQHVPRTFDLHLDTCELPTSLAGRPAVERVRADAPERATRLGTRRLVDDIADYWESFHWVPHLSEIGQRVRRDLKLLAGVARVQEELIDAYREVRERLQEHQG